MRVIGDLALALVVKDAGVVLVVALDLPAGAVEVQAFEVDHDGDQHCEDVTQKGAAYVQDQRDRNVEALQEIAYEDCQRCVNGLADCNGALRVVLEVDQLEDSDPE